MPNRRSFLLTPLAVGGPLVDARAQQRPSLDNPLQLGVDRALVEGGLATALQRAFGRDTGLAVQLTAGPSSALLAALAQGEIDATMTDAPDAEAPLVQQGLAHDRRAVALGDWVLAGPLPAAGGRAALDPARLRGGTDLATALSTLAATAAATSLRFVTPGDGSGSHMAEQAAWRAARVAPAAPWYVQAPPGVPWVAEARRLPGYSLMSRGHWRAEGRAPLALLVEDPRFTVQVHVMRSFRARHPAAKLFADWVTGPRGRRVVGTLKGWRVPAH